jgi:hypothetical protein
MCLQRVAQQHHAFTHALCGLILVHTCIHVATGSQQTALLPVVQMCRMAMNE